jgi:hypothetical protein
VTDPDPTAHWIAATSADERHNDQEAILGDDGWHAIIGDDGPTWTWEVWSTWLHDNDDNIVASGVETSERRAKSAAEGAYASLQETP